MVDWSLFFNGQERVILPLWSILLHIVVAIVIGTVGIFLGRAFGRVARGIIERLDLSKELNRAGIKFHPEIFAENIVKYIIYVAAFIIALNYLGITPIILNIIFVGLITIIILAMFLSLKDFIPNIISGIYIISTSKIKKGEYIKVHGVSGRVHDISLTETTIVSKGNKIIIPNSIIMREQIEILNKK